MGLAEVNSPVWISSSDEIVVGDAEVLAGGNAEGEGAAGAGVVVAGGDGGQGFGPCGIVGGGFGGHSASSAEDEMR